MSRAGGVLSVALMMAAGLAGSVACAAPAPVPYDWSNVRIGGGGFTPGIVFSTVEPGLAYLRSDMGGAYRWDARAKRWAPLQDGVSEGSYMGVESLAVDPVDAGTVYLAAGMAAGMPAAIFRSTDYGAHWQVTPVPFAMGGNEDGRGLGERLAIDPFNHARLLFGSRHRGLWRSEDAGAHWRQVSTFPLAGLGLPTGHRQTHGGLSFVVFDPARKGRIFVGNADPGTQHLFLSQDGGATWRAVPGGPPADLLAAKAALGRDGMLTITLNDGIGPNGIRRGAVWQLDTAAMRWREVTPLRGADAPQGGYMGVAVSTTDPMMIAVSTVDRGDPVDTVWLSRDGGAHWDELWRRSVRDVSSSPFLDFNGKANFGHWIAGLAIDPFDPGHAAYVTGATVYGTQALDKPGEMPWRPWTQGIEQTAVITLISPTGGAHLISGFGDIGGFRHDDLAVSPPRMHLQPFLTNTNTLDYAGRSPAIMVRSGNTHTLKVPDTSLAWSADGGASWEALHLPRCTPHADGSPCPEETGDAAITASADGGAFVAETDKPLLSRDHGVSWTAISGLPRTRVTADKADARRFYALDFTKGRMLRSDDGGASFHPVMGKGLPQDLTAARSTNREDPAPLLAEPDRAGALWLALDGDLWRSTDFGESWRRSGQAIRVERFGLGKGTDAETPALYALGSVRGTRGLWRSLDGGGAWARINDDEHQWGLRIRMVSGDPRLFGRVYVATDGRGLIFGDPAKGT
ncbi:WD40/YVTN/BNR-like repeat-containing protein [Novosphingobium rosa]|uniref:WD40/YVTN/BNR-like repeat-containing protein n=1 Tax=Novosphingobium rosa TaxID=76978 RepID=UPI00082C7E22|nr:hypothetical protein [Novosphingobium rosa]